MYDLIPYGILTERLLSLYGWKLSILIEKLRKGQRDATHARVPLPPPPVGSGGVVGVGMGASWAETEAEAMGVAWHGEAGRWPASGHG